MNAKLKRGFTIIEMVIVIAIIGILAAVLVPTYRNVVDRANSGAALQTSRASLNEWLSVATGSAGVPTAGNDAHGNYLSPAYFMAKQGNGVYQFRYNEGSVERTDDDAEKYMDFSVLDQIEVYLTTPLEDPSFDPERYSAVIYRQEVHCRPDCPHREEHGPGDTYSNFYLLRRADSAYALGGADVIMLISGEQKFWVAAGMEYFEDVTGGFFEDPTLSGQLRVKGQGDVAEKSVILTQYECRTFAEWNTSRYLVTFVKNADDASFVPGFDPDDHTGLNATSMPTAAEISREGYTLEGWNTKADGSGAQYAPGAVVETHEETAFYAVWKAISAPTPEKLTFTLLDDGTGYSVKAASTEITGEVVIPATYEGLPVKVIANNAFLQCSSMTGITIPNSVTTIGIYAFYSCRSLTSITIPDSVTSILGGAFSCCTGLTSITVSPDNSALKSLDGVLYTKDGKTLVSYPGAKSGAYVIPDSVTSIGGYAFSGCNGLTSITIPDGVTSISVYAFSNCSSLTSITVSPDNSAYKSLDGVLYTINGSTLIAYAGGKSGAYVIPDSVTSIFEGAFYNCTGLTSVTIPDSVTSIGISAFSGCSSLTSITIPDSVTSIGSYAFNSCSSLGSINYSGTESQWNAITIAERWRDDTLLTTIHCTDGDITLS